MRIFPVLLLILLIVTLIVSPAAARQTATPIPTLGVSIITSTPGPIIVATAMGGGATAVPLQSNGCYTPLLLPVGGQIVVRGGINVRNNPTLSGALVNHYPNPVVLHLDAGPVCADGYNWWQISGVGQPGWVFEGRPRDYFLRPYVNPETTNCAAPIPEIQAGWQLRTVTGSRVRQTPESDGFVVTVVQPGMILDVTGGPNCFRGLNWWRVRAPFGSTLVDGWIAEGYPGGYFVSGLTSSTTDSGPRCMTNLRLHSGSRAAVTYNNGVPRSLRAAPTTSGALVASLIQGIEVEVINDQLVCADGYNWWQVRIIATGQTGWLAEGRPGNYWFDVLVN